VGTPLTHHFLPRWWGQQHVVEAGTRDKPMVVLLHGWPQHWYAYRHLLRALANDLHLFAIDTRGFGWSAVNLDTRARRSVTASSLAADVTSAMNDLGIEQAHLVGHDWGGWFAFHAALEHPERFSTLTTLAIMPPWLDALQVARHTALLYLFPMGILGDQVARRPAAVRSLLALSTADPRVWHTDDGTRAAQTYTDRLTSPESATSTRLLYRRMIAVELRRACGARPMRLAMPGSVLLGSNEKISHPDLFTGRTGPGELAVHRLARSGHWLLDEAPEAVVHHLRRATGLPPGGDPPPGGPGTPTP
jgi:pimeloyl-ACP methyl ester carboxylesterase